MPGKFCEQRNLVDYSPWGHKELDMTEAPLSMWSISSEMQGWTNHKLEIKIARRNVNNLRYPDDAMLMAKSKGELKSLLMKVKEENDKSGLKFKIDKTKIMISNLNTSW